MNNTKPETVGSEKRNISLFRFIGVVFFTFLFMVNGLFTTLVSSTEPNVTDNLNGSFSADWPLDNPVDYTLYNLTMQNGAVNLTLDGFWWNQTLQSQFETGSLFNIDSTTFPDDLILDSTTFGIGENYIKNGRFETSANWSFDSSDNITAEWNVGSEYGRLHHYSASNPLIIGDQNVSAGFGTGAPIGLPTIPDCLELQDGTSYYQVNQGQQLNITNFYIGNRTGRIKKVVLNGVWRTESGYSSLNSESLRYKDEGGTFQRSSIVPTDNQTWNPESQDITYAYSTWTWSDIANLEVSFLNDDTGGTDFVDWDRIWLGVTIEKFEQTAHINQTFEVLKTTGFNDTLLKDFIKSQTVNKVNFTSVPDNVVLDYSGAFTLGQTTLYSNGTGGNCTWIYNFASDENYGATDHLWVGGTDLVSFTRTLLRFNLSSIPMGSYILDATMQLWVIQVPNKDINVSVHRLIKDWDEGYQDYAVAVDGVTWDMADTDPPIPWMGGGEFNQTIYNLSTVYATEASIWHDFNITSLAQEWVSGTPNYGLIMKHSNEPPDNERVQFTSDDGVPGQRPKLILSYITPHYHPYGNFSSQVLDAGKVVDSWGNISWTGNTPPGTTIAIETRSGDTSVPDASWAPWSGNYSQPGDTIVSAPGQYIQYRAHLQTTDINVTPELYDVTIIFERTNLTFDYLVETALNPTEAEMSIFINDTEVWTHDASSTSSWSNDSVDISEWILSRGPHNISLQFRLIIETNSSVNCSVGYDNILIGALGNESIGEYISMGFDAGSQAIWDEISWNATLPSETEVIIQTRSSPDNTWWGAWSPAYTKPSGDSITSINDRYLQYRAILVTRNESISPVLHDVNISYFKYRSNGILETISDYVPAAVTNWGQFTSTGILNGQNITFYYSINSGGTWYDMPSMGNMDGVDTSSGTIRFKAEFSTTNTSLSPELLHFSLLYYTNNPPQLMNVGYTNEPGALGGGWFNFTVMYLDEENSYPAPLKVHITGPIQYNQTMSDLDTSDTDMTDGKWFYYNLTLPKGSYQFRIVASDGAIWNITSFSSFTVNNNPPELKYINIWPPTGAGGTSFNFTVVYFDKDNDPPDALLPVNLTINGPVSYNVTMMELNPTDTTYTDGKEYYYPITLAEGAYTYFISAFDGEDWIFTETYPLAVSNNPPTLDSPSVSPSSGFISTTFTFTVNYIDLDNDTAGTVTLNLSGPSMSGPHIMIEVDPGDTTYTDGKLYNITLTSLTKGLYTHHFAASDADGFWVETGEIALPEVLNSEPQIVTSNNVFAEEDTLYSNQYQFSDADADSGVWLLDTNASWLTVDPDTGYLNGTPGNGDVGWFWVNVTVSDNDGGFNWTQFIVTVNNTPPQITTTSPTQWAVEGYLYTFDFQGEDEGEGNAYWTLATNASWLSINDSTGELAGIPQTSDIGSFRVNVTLDDGNGGHDYLEFTIIVNDVSIPIADAGSDDFTWEDSAYPFDGSGSTDNSGAIANYTWYFGDGSVGYGIAPTHTYTNQGVYVVVLIVTDETGNEGFDTMKISVLNVDPVADAGPDLTGNEGEPVSFDASSSYDTPSDNAGLVYVWDFDLDGEFDDGFGIVSVYTWFDEGTFVAGLKVIDNNGNFSTDFVNITINNLPPSVSLEDSYSGMEGAPIYFLATASDLGNDQLLYRWDWDDDGVNDTQWSNKPYADNSWLLFGTYTINVEVWDGDDGYANTTADVTVIRPEQPPVISGVGGRYVRFGYPYILDLDPYINDPDTPKDDLTVTTSDLTHIKVNGLILTLKYPESMQGQTRVVTITVSDGKNTDNDTLTVTITDNFPPEVSGDIPDVRFDEGETLDSAYDLDNYFTDKDGDPLDYTVVGNIHVRPVIDPSTHAISFSPDPNWYGVEDITVRAYDPKGAFVEQVVRVTVNPVNFPPTIGGIQDVFVRPNSPWELKVLDPVYVWDDDSILDLSLFTNSSFVTPSPTKEGVLVFYYLDPSISTDIVKISVSDGEFTASTDIIVRISITNWPPYIKDYSYPSDVRFDEDTQLSDHFDLNDFFADNASDALTFTQIVPESNLIVTIDNQGRVSFSASENWFGQTTVTFKAQDTAGAWASFTINVTVSPVNDPPEILAQITYLRIEQGETWIIDLDDYFTDLESGDNLTFSSNKASIKIDPITHEARWDRNQEESLDGLIFTASDGEDSVSTEPVNLKVVGAFNWLWVILAAVLGALGVFVYRGLRYRYRIEEVLLVDHAGILLSHLSRGESRVAVDAELVSGMLTAVQDFVKDSFLRGKVDEETLLDKKKSLEKLEFAGHHLVMEQGMYSFICAVISGTVNKRLRKRMRDVLGEFETEYEEILIDWDGVIERFEGAEEILKKLIPKGEKPPKIYSTVEELELGMSQSAIRERVESKEERPEDNITDEDIVDSEDHEEEPPDEGPRLPPHSPSLD